jgi:outer membrane protein assembly factor BamA
MIAGWMACFLVAHGQPMRVDSIVVTGLKKTKLPVVTRQMVFQVGDTINLAELDKLTETNRSNIYNTSLFTTVTIANEIGDSVIEVHIAVQERWYIWPTPYVNLNERTINEWLADPDLERLVYGMGVEWYNLSGWNDKLVVYAQGGYNQALTASYNRPFLFPKAQIDGTLSFTFLNDIQIVHGTDSGYQQLVPEKLYVIKDRMRQSYSGQLTFGKRFTARKIFYAFGGYQHFNLHDSVFAHNPEYLPDGLHAIGYPVLGVSYVNDQRDIRSYPLAGYKYGGGLRNFGIPGVSSTHFGKLTLSFSHHIPLSKRWNFAYGSQQFFLLGKTVPYFDKFFIGFGSFLRGYEPYVIDGSVVNLTKAEWKFGIIPYHFAHLKWIPFRKFQDFPMGLYLSAYCDAGYVHDWTFNNRDNTLKDRLLLGYGAGLNLITIYDFLLRVEYSRNIERDDRHPLGRGGLYFSTLVSIQ